MARRKTLAGLAILSLLSLRMPAMADEVVILKNGARLTGRLVSEDDKAVVLEIASSAGGRSRITIQRDKIESVERGAVEGTAGREAKRAVRDEWWLLRSDGRTVGTRHLLLLSSEDGAAAGSSEPGWKLEEDVSFLPTGRLPAVRVHRIEVTTRDWAPVSFHYSERGEAGTSFRSEPYETMRSGPVKNGVWEVSERGIGKISSAKVEVGGSARGPLALREALARATPRPTGLVEMPLLDAARAEVRTIRAGFVSIDPAPGETREDVLRIEDGSRVMESRWGVGDPPRCLLEDVAPGVSAVPCTREQAEAVLGPTAPTPAPSPRDPGAPVAAPEKHLTVPDVGFDLTLPGASWVPEVVANRAEEVGSRVVAKVTSRIHAADVRIEWDPRGASTTAAEAESAILERLKAVPTCRDLSVLVARAAVPSPPGAWKMTLRGTLRGERLRTVVLVADRGAGRLTLLAACPEGAWDDAKVALDALLGSLRWL